MPTWKGLCYRRFLPGELLQSARGLNARLAAVKRDLASSDVEWYRYDSIANVMHVERLLEEAKLSLPDVIGDGLTADIGCADGEFSFFLESLGYRVHAVDHPPSNHNGMRGVQTLRERLGSSIEVHPIDIDGRFVLPANHYQAAFVLGVLYHLKNPFYALEALSKQVTYCFLSTRILTALPGIKAPIGDLPVAYLLEHDELNADNSNFWLLSEAGLRRLLRRTKWEVCAWFTATADRKRKDSDCRAFCLVRSHYAMAHLELISGWHGAEEGGFRWTAGSFSVRRPDASRRMALDFYLPDHRAIKLEAAATKGLGAESYTGPGIFRYVKKLPEDATRIDFRVDGCLPPHAGDRRELGIVVTSLEFEP